MIGAVSVPTHGSLYKREMLYAACENARLKLKQPWAGPCLRASEKSTSKNKPRIVFNSSQEQDRPTNHRVIEPQPKLIAEIEIAIHPRR